MWGEGKGSKLHIYYVLFQSIHNPICCQIYCKFLYIFRHQPGSDRYTLPLKGNINSSEPVYVVDDVLQSSMQASLTHEVMCEVVCLLRVLRFPVINSNIVG